MKVHLLVAVSRGVDVRRFGVTVDDREVSVQVLELPFQTANPLLEHTPSLIAAICRVTQTAYPGYGIGAVNKITEPRRDLTYFDLTMVGL